MLDIALKLLEEITSCGFQAYIVGGFVRDNILGIMVQLLLLRKGFVLKLRLLEKK